VLFPSHGRTVQNPGPQLLEFEAKLQQLEKLYLRGYGVEAASAAYQDKVSTPTVVSNVWQVTPHVFKFKRPNFWPNFGLIMADSGRALVVDCGLLDEKFIETALEGMRVHLGLKAIDAVIVTHMHGDHFLEAPYLRRKWGAAVWALDNMVDKMEHPERFDYAAPIQAYGKKNADGSLLTGVRVDRAFNPGESFSWEGHSFTVDWMPGQTEFALCLHGMIDGRKIAFTGDNLFGDPDDPTQTGHEAMVAHNSAILEEGYIYCGEYLKRLKPDILVGGHSFVMNHPARFIERFRRWSNEMRDAFQSLSSDKDYRFWFDPFWVRAEPYRVILRPGERATLALHLRNFSRRRQDYRLAIHAPPGLRVEPGIIETRIEGESRRAIPVQIEAEPTADRGVHLLGLDATVGGRRYGERFDVIVGIDSGVPASAGLRSAHP
jgi:glyoxylase-like metal-dependent hydrolase (beta-lactamase superfamily II)